MLAFPRYCGRRSAWGRENGFLLRQSSYIFSAHNAIGKFPVHNNFRPDLGAQEENCASQEKNASLMPKAGKNKTFMRDLTDVTGGAYPFSSRENPFEKYRVLETKTLGFGFKTCMEEQGPSFIFRRLASSKPNKAVEEYQMPSVTWGAVLGRKEKLVSRVIICDYLKSIGIVPDELEHIELPSTVNVMQERVEFLQRIGLSIEDINQYPLMLGCSVRKNMGPVLDYLNKVGIEKRDLPGFLRRYPQVLHASVVVDLMPVIRFLRGLDIEKEDIPLVLQKYPDLLGFKLDGTMSTSVGYLVSFGVSPRDIGPMMTQYPQILGMRVQKVIKPFVDYLISLGLPKQVVARMIEKRPYILGYDLEESMKPNVESLLTFGVRKQAIPSVIAQYPQIIGTALKPKLFSQQYFFNFNIKVDPEDFYRILEKMPQIVSLPRASILKRIEFLKGRGFLTEDVAKMVVACPQILAVNVELMKHSVYYFKSEIKRPLQELVEFPAYFIYSLEFRIKPRFQRILSKGITCSLEWILNCSDQRFEERLEANYIEIEEKGPLFRMGGPVELPRYGDESEEEDDESEDEVIYKRTVSL